MSTAWRGEQDANPGNEYRDDGFAGRRLQANVEMKGIPAAAAARNLLFSALARVPSGSWTASDEAVPPWPLRGTAFGPRWPS